MENKGQAKSPFGIYLLKPKKKTSKELKSEEPKPRMVPITWKQKSYLESNQKSSKKLFTTPRIGSNRLPPAQGWSSKKKKPRDLPKWGKLPNLIFLDKIWSHPTRKSISKILQGFALVKKKPWWGENWF